jgi:TonB family protein
MTMRNKVQLALMSVMLLAGTAAAQEAPAGQPAPAPPPGGQMRLRQAGPGMKERTPMPAPMARKRPDLGAWWKNSDVVREIGLSEQQVNQIEQTFFDHRLKLIDLKATVEREETRLQPLMEADQVNEAQISTQIDKLLAARGALEKANVMMMLSIRKVLTVEQWKKLETIRQEREAGFPGVGWRADELPIGEGAYRIRVDGDDQQSQLTHKVQPAYSELAKQARIQGTVRLQAIISRDGRVTQLEVLSGHPLLVQSALEAVRQWRYRPTLLYGEPREVTTTVDVAFRLND